MENTKNKLKEKLGVDDVRISKNGEIRVMNSYFYTLGKSEEDIVKVIEKELPDARIIDKGNHRAGFNGGDTIYKGSHFYVTFVLLNE